MLVLFPGRGLGRRAFSGHVDGQVSSMAVPPVRGNAVVPVLERVEALAGVHSSSEVVPIRS
jgi:hypothetical protein